MPSYYDSGRFGRKLKRQKIKTRRINEELRKKVSLRKDRPADELPLKLGREIAKLRISVGLTQERLGELAGTYQSAIGRIEAGKENLTLKNLENILKILNKKLKIEIL